MRNILYGGGKKFNMYNLWKKIVSVCLMLIICLNYSLTSMAVETSEENIANYEYIEFVASDEEEEREIIHFLFAKLAYDYLDEYEGKTVAEYVEAYPGLYDVEIWEGSGITYEALYKSIVGDWQIYKIFNNNDTTGFYGVVFIKDSSVIFTLRGSDMFTDEFPLDESNDWVATDFKFAVMNKLSPQFDDLDRCYSKLLKYLARDGYRDYEMTFSGHSLGGALVTYASLVTGKFGYSFDGACGHVVDLVYYDEYLEIDDFTGVDDVANVKYVNYTDTNGYVVADLIQHTRTDSLYQIDRKTKIDNLTENSLLPKLADAGAHIILSCLYYEENRVFFTDKVSINESGYTYMPEGPLYIDTNKNILEATIEEFDITAPWNTLNNFDIGYMWDLCVGNIKTGRVVLASVNGGEIYANKGTAYDSEYDVNTVMYGGSGNDYMHGGMGDDILIAGAGESDILHGYMGNDTYIIDCNPGQKIEIEDAGGEKSTIIFRNINKTILKQMKVNQDGSIALSNNQFVYLNVAQSYEDIEIYVYCNGKMSYLGSYEDVAR